ncbi:MAG: sigma 54-interacting transcriptional regulator [Polyangiaceae bacterium]
MKGSHTITLRDRTLVGSAPAAGIVISDPAVSRIHAELELRNDGVWVKDLGSRNGTFVDGVMVVGARIPERGKITLGSTELSLADTAPEPVELWPEDHFGPMIGASTVMRQLFAFLARIAPTDSPVLVLGETGTGKELIATAIHEASPRASKPFVVVDCAALPENLIESELFGHAKGAFTGAVSSRVGAVEAADGGTVFLDEIGELPLSLQPRLLRVLESGTIRRVGETTRRKVDVRFVSATHRDIRTMVNAGAFREDLYFRLAVLPVMLPPLREHPGDIPLLVRHFLPGNILPTSEMLAVLTKQPWLGNVRELRNFVRRAAALGTREAMSMSFDSEPKTGATHAALPSEARISIEKREPNRRPDGDFERDVSSLDFDSALRAFRERWIDLGEREYVRRLLSRHDKNVAAAAKEADVDRTYLYRLIRKQSP